MSEVEHIPNDRVEVLDREDAPSVVTHANPFSTTAKVRYAKPGATVEELVADSGMAPEYRNQIGVWINDRFIERANWSVTKPAKGEVMYVRVLVGKGGKDILRAVFMVIITAVVLFYAPYLAGAIPGIGTGFGLQLATVAIGAAMSAVGYLALNALIPPPGLQNNSQDQRYQLTGTQNQFAPYANIPRVFGKRRLFPLHAARPYSEIQGDDEYLRICLVVGWGPLELTNIRIGDTPITAFEGVEVETREGWASDTPLTLFSKTVKQEDFTVQLEPIGTTLGTYYPAPGSILYLATRYRYDTLTATYAPDTSPTNTNDWHTRTTDVNSVEFSVDFSFPQGLFRIDGNGNRKEATVVTNVQYRIVGSSGAWTNAVWQNSADDGFNIAGTVTTKGTDTTVVRRSGRCVLPAAGQYDIRCRRTTINSGDKYVDLVWWSALRSIKQDYPVLQTGLSLIAIRMKASNQLNGVPSSINCDAESYLPVWNGTVWTFTKTNNPAWAYTDLLRRRGPEVMMPDSRIDIAGMVAWATANATTAPNASEPYWSFNGVIEGGSIYEGLRRIAAGARANYIMKDGKHSVVRDIQQTTPIQHITPRNSFGYSGSKAFIDYPHALRVTFVNAASGYQKDEVVVYDDGYNAGNATRFEVLDLADCTSSTQAWREGRYHMAAARLRPEEHVVQMDIENLKATVGDLVRFSQDVIAIGVQSSRIRTRTTVASNTTAFVLDDDCYFETGSSYSVRIRKADGSSVVYAVNNPGTGYTSTVTLTTPVATSGAPNVGDLVMFGITNAETAPMIIKRVEPADELTASVTMVDAQAGVYTADTGTIPAFNTYITLPSLPLGGSMEPVFISSIRSDDSVLVIMEDGSIVYRIGVGLQQPEGSAERTDYFELQYKIKTSSGGWQTIRIERSNPFAFISPVVVGDIYQLRSRGVSNTGGQQPWSPIIEHTVAGKNNPPGPPTSVGATAIPGGVRLNWTNPLDEDFWQVEIWENTTNTTVGATLVGTSTDNTYPRLGLLASGGVRYYFLRAVDTSGNPSTYAASVNATPLNKGLFIALSNDSVVLQADAAGTVGSFATAIGQMTVWDGDTDVTASATLSSPSAVNCTGSVNTALNTPVTGAKGSYRVTAMSADNAKFTVQAVYNGVTVTKEFSLAKARAGAAGVSGVSLMVDNKAVQLFAYADGTVPSFTGASGQLKVLDGGVDVTASATLSAVATGCTGSINTALNTPVAGAKGTYRVTAMSADTATLVLTAVYGGVTYTETFSLSKTKAGYEIVGTLPATNLFNGRVVFLTSDNKLYTYRTGSSSWVNAVNTTDLAGQLATAQFADGSVTNVKVAAFSITASRLVLTDTSNMVNDAEFNEAFASSGASWRVAVGTVTQVTSDPLVTALTGVRVAKVTGNGTGTANRYDFIDTQNALIPVEPGKPFYAAAEYAVTSGFNGRIYSDIEWSNAAGGVTGYGTVGIADYWTVAASATVNGVFAAQLIPPAGTVRANFRLIVDWNTDFNTRNKAGTGGFARPRLRRAANGELIVDGSITTNKIGALQVTTNELAAGAVTAAKISVTDLSAINANLGTITAGTIQNSAGTFGTNLALGVSVWFSTSYMKVVGAAFGATSNLMEWWGTKPSGATIADPKLSTLTKTNGLWAQATDGKIYQGAIDTSLVVTPLTLSFSPVYYDATHINNTPLSQNVTATAAGGSGTYTYVWSSVPSYSGANAVIVNPYSATCTVTVTHTAIGTIDGVVQCVATDPTTGKTQTEYWSYYSQGTGGGGGAGGGSGLPP